MLSGTYESEVTLKYQNSIHYREDPFQEIESVLQAGNDHDSVHETLTSRLIIEERQHYPDTETIERIYKQLAYLGDLGLQQAS